jgi:hypothetical protein
MYRVEGILIFLISITILYIAYLYFNRQGKVLFKWNDIPPEPFEDTNPMGSTQTKEPNSLLSTNEDYRSFFDWHSRFCQTWNKVIEQSMSVDNYKGNTVDYVKNLQSQQNKIFVKCYDEITADPEPFVIENKISTVELYLSTMNFMATKITSILQKTKDALAGNPQKESFEDISKGQQQQGQCGCLTPDVLVALQKMANTVNTEEAKKQDEDQKLKRAIANILSKIKPIVKDKASLNGQLTIINKGLNELLEYKRKAETGQIKDDIKIPE